ncbi:hypothetical protein Tco_0822131 [Tanacetum coccineum]|uniref:Synaptobrevin, longin-like domain protein n=1 Tax=Tanacetum coccineum TaxID=301880 RepID=A0ABQ5AGU6_9ASTR
MVAYLQKSEGSEGFHQIIDFLNASHIQYALTKNPTIYVSFIKQFWRTATASTDANGQVELTASIDEHAKTITEAYLRRHLKLEDNDGVTSLPNSEIFEQLALIGYETDFDKLTFQKGNFSPQWRFLIHTILQCLSPKKTTWEQFSSNIATAIICLATNRTYNFSKMIFDAMKVEGLESDLKKTKQTYSTALTKLILRVKKLEKTIKTTKAKRRARIVVSKDEDALEDSFKQGRKISNIDEDPNISLVQNEEMTWFQDADTEVQKDADIHIRTSDDTEHVLEEAEPTELVEYQGSVEKGEKEVTTPINYQTYIRRRRDVSTGSGGVSTASRQDSIANVKAKDKGKAIMIELEHEKKTKKQLELERLGHKEAVRLQEQIDEEERQRIARDAEIARQLHEEINKAGQERVVAEDGQDYVIDWSDPSVIRYHALKIRPRSVAEVRKNMCIYLKNQGGYEMKDFKGMSYDDIRPIFEKVWDQINSFVPIDSELEVQRKLKRAGQDVEAEPAKRQRTREVLESVQEQTDKEPKIEELSQEQLHQLIITVLEEGIHVEALQTKYPIIEWEIYSEDTMKFWKIIRLGDHTEVYQTFADILKNFNKEDLLKLWSLVQERFNSSGLTDDKEKELCVELKMLFEPNEETLLELQRYMHDPLKW